MGRKYEPHIYAMEVGAIWGLLGKDWGAPDDPSPERRAARLQLRVAMVVIEWLRVQRVTQTEFAAKIGMDRAKLNRVLHGMSWASLIDIERLLGGCGETLMSISLAVGDGPHQPAAVKRVIRAYLREQLAMVAEESAHTEPAHPST